jgi:hypothetical protein
VIRAATTRQGPLGCEVANQRSNDGQEGGRRSGRRHRCWRRAISARHGQPKPHCELTCDPYAGVIAREGLR